MQDKIDWFNKNKNKIANIFFYIAFSIELVIMMVEHSAFDVPFRGRLTHIAFALFGCKVLLTKYSKKEWIAIILLGIIGVLSYFSCQKIVSSMKMPLSLSSFAFSGDIFLLALKYSAVSQVIFSVVTTSSS